MKVRPNRIAEEIKKELVQLIRSAVKDPRVDGLISITDVEVTRDLSYATVYISKYGTAYARQEALKGLEASRGFLRSELSKRLKLRTVPELIFKLDDSLEYGAKIEGLLQEINSGNREE
ncbi:MAG: 30S ribosome-binding factor RbfA [Peptococcaceae bacterium]|nr:30S ribosome-binding factor RbfA [Peptococcaceae bacterium]